MLIFLLKSKCKAAMVAVQEAISNFNIFTKKALKHWPLQEAILYKSDGNGEIDT